MLINCTLHVLMDWHGPFWPVVQASTAEDIPGQPQNLQGKLLEQAKGALQRFSPFSRIHQHVCGFHFYSHDITRQLRKMLQSCCYSLP